MPKKDPAASKRCPNCGACQECGSRPAPYVPYVPYVPHIPHQPPTWPWSQKWTYTSGSPTWTNTAGGNYAA